MGQVSVLGRAGFWRRTIALVVDLFLAAVVTQIVAVVAYRLSDGRVQYSTGIVLTTCSQVSPMPRHAVPLDFEPNYATDCRAGLLGMTHAHFLRLGRRTADGSITKDISYSATLNDAGEVIRAIKLDILPIPLLLFFRWWLDFGVGKTPGRLLFRIRVLRVVDGEADQLQPSAKALGLRYLLIGCLLLPTLLGEAYLQMTGAIPDAWFATAAITVLAISLSAFQIARRRDAFYDVWVGTTVWVVSKEQGYAANT